MKIFVKPLQNYTPEQVRLTYQHAFEVWQAVEGHPSGRSPRPLRHDEKSITYEFVDLPRSLLDLVRDERSNTVTVDALSKAGAILAGIHLGAAGRGLLHGDYVVHNLFHDNDTLYVIDAHPPETLGYRTTLLYGAPVRDVLAFVTALVSGLGYRAAWHRRALVDVYLSEFTDGYRSETSLPAISIRTIVGVLYDTVQMRYRAGFGIVSALLHGTCAATWIARFYVLRNAPKIKQRRDLFEEPGH
jgi:tRNA A-37 threonylcarbamoyl transferase component Bud32